MSEYRDQSDLWNKLPLNERKRLSPYMIATQILHYEQCKIKAMRSHEALMKDYNDHILNCKRSLKQALSEVDNELF